MKITVDTNVLVRAITRDDPRQSKAAEAELKAATMVALATPTLCELVWVLSRGYKIAGPEIAETIRDLMNSENVVFDRPAVEAGLVLLEAGGDFADAVIAYEGRWLGADTFVSFDRHAIRLMDEQGERVRLLS